MSALLDVNGLSKTFRYHTGLFRRHTVEAVHPMDLSLDEGKTLAIIGENGSGKSTLAKLIAGMVEPTQGEICVNGERLWYGDYRHRCKLIRMIFQDPNTSLNPKMQIGQILEGPLKLNTDLTPQERENRIIATLRKVGLLPDHASFYPQMLATGQKQRVSLARSLILEPKIIVADEALTQLDMSMRSQILNLMLELQENLGISYIYVSQHIGVVKHISDKVLVMQQGHVVERGDTKAVFCDPKHDLTRRMVESHFGEVLTPAAWERPVEIE